jgi:IclR family transcriptional regulator, KDG regulon repressor
MKSPSDKGWKMKLHRLPQKTSHQLGEASDPPRRARDQTIERRPSNIADPSKLIASLSRSVAKALAIIEYVGLEQLCTIPQLSARTGLPKSTLHRLLGTLVDEGFLYRAAHGQYKVSFKLWRIGATAVDLDSIRQNARDVLANLVKQTSETAHYSVYEDGCAVYVEKMDGLHPVRAYTSLGGRSPAYAGATGKALLAWQGEEEIRRVAKSAKRFTTSTLVGVSPIIREMSRIRKLGYAVNQGEWRDGVWGIAAPVLEPGGDALAAVGISGPEDRIRAGVDSLAKAVMRAAAELSQREQLVARHGTRT